VENAERKEKTGKNIKKTGKNIRWQDVLKDEWEDEDAEDQACLICAL
jgi:hypothetical protein